MDRTPGIHSGYKVRTRLNFTVEFTIVTFIIYDVGWPTTTSCFRI